MSKNTEHPIKQQVVFTHFATLGSRAPETVTLTWGELRGRFENAPVYPNKESCPLFSGARFGGQPSPNGSLRHNGNVLDVGLVVLDYDAGEIPPERVRDMLAVLGIEALVVTTPSNGLPGKGHRYRIVALLSAPVTPERWHSLARKLNALLGGTAATESFTLSQPFYYGRVQGVEYKVLRSEGVPLDQLRDIEHVPEQGPPAARQRTAAAPDNLFAMATKRARGGAEEVREALSHIPNDGPADWTWWNRVLMAIYAATAGSDEGLELAREWSNRCPEAEGADSVDARWQHFHTSPPTSVGMGTLWHEAGGRAAVREVREPAAGFPAGYDDKRNTTLAAAVELQGQLDVRFDEFSQRVMLMGAPPWNPSDATAPRPWTDRDTIEAHIFLQGCKLNPSKEATGDAISAIAHRRAYHPVRDYLDNLTWDGVPRLNTLARGYLGGEDTEYTRTVLPMALIGAVARIYQPGAKVDNVLILEGAQGLYKSTACSALFGAEWFADELPDVSSKDAAIQLLGKWAIELAELDAMRRAERSAMKKFISRCVDTYRPPYGRTAVDVPRQCVFVGTTNDATYLQDPTGNRRWWPLRVLRRCDVEALRRDRDQLWAEAVARYQAGEPWWLTPEQEQRLAVPEQDARREADPWEDPIRQWLTEQERTMVTPEEVARGALFIAFEKHNAAINSRIASCLQRCGYERKKVTVAKNDRRYRYVSQCVPLPPQ